MADKNNSLSQKCILHDVLIKEFSYIWINSGEGVVEKVNIPVAVQYKEILLKWDFIKTYFALVSLIIPLSIVLILICKQTCIVPWPDLFFAFDLHWVWLLSLQLLSYLHVVGY